MSESDQKKPEVKASRRGFLAAAGGLVAAAGAGAATAAQAPPEAVAPLIRETTVPFWGLHQGGIVTPQQGHTYFAAFDLNTDKIDDVAGLLSYWTDAAARMTEGQPAAQLETDVSKPASDSGEALDLQPSRLTITFGFGPGLFVKDGHDRYGLAARRPAALIDMPRFNGDQLVPANTGGDLSIQACADDPQVAFHAVRQLARMAYGAATMRWTQTGFLSAGSGKGTPRNLMGFKDGTQNPTPHPSPSSPRPLDEVVWVGSEGPDWMQGGSYASIRRIRIALEHWDRTEVDYQEQVVGRHKYSGAPLGGKHEMEPLNLDAADKDGNSVIPDNAHVRLAAAASNDGAQILRRGYSYNDGSNVTAERWPPWRQGLEYDAGLLFVAYQRDLRAGFVKIFGNMAKLDAMNQFTTHTGGGFFACPRGAAKGEFIGQKLFDKA